MAGVSWIIPTMEFNTACNMNGPIALGKGIMLQYSYFMTKDQRAAKAIRDLVKHYDGQVMMFRGELLDL